MHLKLWPGNDQWRASALRQGDESEWRRLFDKYAQPLFGFFYSRLGDKQASEDLMQDTFVAVVRSISQFDATKGNIQQWLWTIARRRMADALRIRYREAPIQALSNHEREIMRMIDNHQPLPDALLVRSETQLFIGTVLGSLADHYRKVLVEKYMNRRSMEDIAGMMGQSVKAIESLLTRARIAFRERLKEMTEEISENEVKAIE